MAKPTSKYNTRPLHKKGKEEKKKKKIPHAFMPATQNSNDYMLKKRRKKTSECLCSRQRTLTELKVKWRSRLNFILTFFYFDCIHFLG
jgi:hypothetical protein